MKPLRQVASQIDAEPMAVRNAVPSGGAVRHVNYVAVYVAVGEAASNAVYQAFSGAVPLDETVSNAVREMTTK
jgi:hypothetical protein